ncbi:hypothetical protein [uncultured Sphingomonas sp.]|uniref:hypothetical protein n=1 Tax=uncultured Sphingomonas sp. TaxID=158754 RepID=UPI0026000878|nr:hypothetical protein [uncultured Sphingomonas sp.]
MIPGLALTAAAGIARDWWKAGVGALLAAPLFFLLGQCSGRSTGEAMESGRQAQASVAAMQIDAGAKDTATIERTADHATIQTQQKEQADAIRTAPAGAPDAARVALNCQRLRQAGRDPASLPATCRSGGGGAAPSH